jgi:hypothetical protein
VYGVGGPGAGLFLEVSRWQKIRMSRPRVRSCRGVFEGAMVCPSEEACYGLEGAFNGKRCITYAHSHNGLGPGDPEFNTIGVMVFQACFDR